MRENVSSMVPAAPADPVSAIPSCAGWHTETAGVEVVVVLDVVDEG